ncbi:MAG TPA: DUF4347 domain-containing protein [Methylococcaceae bacterium]|nr:DUF4347 domain-containing protein [Methylococcaceae bacterium]
MDTRRELVFLDTALAGWEILLAGFGSDVEVVLLDPTQDGLEQIAAYLSSRSSDPESPLPPGEGLGEGETPTTYDAIHIYSHGSSGELQLGSLTLTQDNLDQYQTELAVIGSALTDTGDLLLYGCNVAQGEEGIAFLNDLSRLTGADIAASTDLTGAGSLGGDWVLEASTGVIEAGQALSEEAQQDYSHVLNYTDDYDLALMAKEAYNDNPQSVAGWEVLDTRREGEFFAVAFQKDDRIVIAYRGTERIGSTDVSADLAIANPLAAWDAEFDEAIKFADMVLAHNSGKHISVTGHSLGGALAQVAAQMFGFDGATFDPGGAGNLINSTEFGTWAANLGTGYTGYPDIAINQGPASGFTNYLVDHSLVSGWIGDHIGGTEQLDFFAYATTEEFVIQTSTQVAHFALDQFNLGFLADAVTGFLTTYVFHQMDGILDLMSIKRGDEITASALASKTQQTLQQTSDSGDVGFPGAGSGQTQAEYRSSSYNPYVFADDGDNTIYGYAGNDIIYGLAGNDTVYAGDGNDTINTAQGNDVIDAGDGSDTVNAGSGDDVIRNTGYGFDSVDGGSGNDTLTVDFSAIDNSVTQHFVSYSMFDAGGNWLSSNAGSSYDQIHTALANASSIRVEARFYWDGSQRYRSYTDYRNIENVNITGIDSNFSDLIIAQGAGNNYVGGSGMDTYYADWSGWTAAVAWDNDGQAVTLNGVTVSGMERLLLATGSGNDILFNTGVLTNDRFITGAGNDQVSAGGGNDLIDGGSGDDTVEGGLGNDTIDGGSGNDVAAYASASAAVNVNLGLNAAQNTLGAGTDTLLNIENLTGSAYNDVLTGNANANILDGGNGNDTIDGGAGNDVASYASALAAVSVDLGVNTAQNTLGAGTDTLLNIENLTGSAYNDTLTGNANANILVGGNGYDTLTGGAGDDTLTGGWGYDAFAYAVSSNGTDCITDLSVGDVIKIGGANFATAIALGDGSGVLADQIQLANSGGITRLFIGTDTIAGADITIDLTGTFNTSQLAALGVQIGVSGGASFMGSGGHDFIEGGVGADTMQGGAGDDTYTVNNKSDKIFEDGSAGIDTVEASISFKLGKNLENLSLTGSGNLNGTGNSLANQMTGNSGDNWLLGGAGGDTLVGGEGNDTLAGGMGQDTADYSDSAGPVTVRLSYARAQDTGGAGTDTLRSIEHLVGSAYNDILTGSRRGNQLDGGAGDDTLSGGLGKDTLIGGQGEDLFRFDTAPDPAHPDHIADFVSGEDRILFDDAVFNALTGTGTLTTPAPFAADDARFQLGSSALENDDRILYDESTGALYYDADGSGTSAAVQIALLEGAPNLQAQDVWVG